MTKEEEMRQLVQDLKKMYDDMKSKGQDPYDFIKFASNTVKLTKGNPRVK